MHNTISRIYLWNVSKFQKFINWKFKKFILYMTQTFTCLKFCYMASSIKMLCTLKQSWKRIFIGIFS